MLTQDQIERMRMLYLEMKRSAMDYHRIAGPYGFDIALLGLVSEWESDWKKLKETLK